MAYATVGDWAARFGILDESIDPTIVTDALTQASVQINRMIGRPEGLEPRTVTDRRWVHRTNVAGDRHIYLPDWPLYEPERWFCTLASLLIYDEWAELQQTVTVGDCTLWVERQGLVILPDANYVEDSWTVEATYDCGYGTDVDTADIPEDLVAACLDLAETRVGSVLTVGRRVDRPAYFVEQDVERRLEPWRKLAVA